MLFKTKLRAGALQYAIFISILMALIVLAVISLSYIQNKMRIKSRFYKNTIENVNYAFQYVVDKDLAYDDEFQMTIDEEKGDTTLISRSAWGVFDIVKTSSKIRNESFRKTALMGGRKNEQMALNLMDLHRPLVLVGNAIIEGDVMLPEKGVKRGSIAGKSYYNEELIYGSIRKSKSELPIIRNKKGLIQLSQGNFDFSAIDVFDQVKSDRVTNSFFDKTLLIKSRGAIVLEDVALSGNILIQSDSLVVIRKTAILEDIIVVAPHILVEDEVQGVFQALATIKLEVGMNCILDYPSSLVLVDQLKKNEQFGNKPMLWIHKNCEIKGVVAYLTAQEQGNNKAQIYIGNNTDVIGEVYSEMNLELLGNVSGSVMTRGFVANQNGASYQNHILDGKIFAHELPEQYCGLIFEESHTGIVKWMY